MQSFTKGVKSVKGDNKEAGDGYADYPHKEVFHLFV